MKSTLDTIPNLEPRHYDDSPRSISDNESNCARTRYDYKYHVPEKVPINAICNCTNLNFSNDILNILCWNIEGLAKRFGEQSPHDCYMKEACQNMHILIFLETWANSVPEIHDILPGYQGYFSVWPRGKKKIWAKSGWIGYILQKRYL